MIVCPSRGVVWTLGGEDHKTGQASDTRACYERLEQKLSLRLLDISFTHRWSGQVIETPDGLPYIGQVTDHQYAAAGFSGNGLTFGTLSAIMMSDAICGRANRWSELFDPKRLAMGRGLWDYAKENADYPYYMVRDLFAGADGRSLRSVKRGEGRNHGKTVAAYRSPSGTLTLRSATCTHMGCRVARNEAEHTWDCPCHGSRFTPEGEVIFRACRSAACGSAAILASTRERPWARRVCCGEPHDSAPISYFRVLGPPAIAGSSWAALAAC